MGTKGKSKYNGQFYEGQSFGKWQVLSPEVKVEGEAKVKCRCKCGTERYVSALTLIKKKSTACTVCSHKKFGKDNPSWKSISDIVPIRFTKRGMTADDVASIIEEWYKCRGACALTGKSISFEDKTASLDRIDSKKGYVRGNIQWVHIHANICKNLFDQDYFLTLCHAIVQLHPVNPQQTETQLVFGRALK